MWPISEGSQTPRNEATLVFLMLSVSGWLEGACRKHDLNANVVVHFIVTLPHSDLRDAVSLLPKTLRTKITSSLEAWMALC